MRLPCGINLRPDDGAPGCGAAFVLRNSPYASRTIRYDEWVIDVVKGAKTVIARGRSPRTIERAVEDGLAAANVGLDLMCFQDSERLLIDRYDDEHVSWCPAPAGDGLSVVATAAHVLELGLGATGTVRDPHGELVPTSSPSSASWHPSYRYFRVSVELVNGRSVADRRCSLEGEQGLHTSGATSTRSSISGTCRQLQSRLGPAAR
jgi:hypothetical protein